MRRLRQVSVLAPILAVLVLLTVLVLLAACGHRKTVTVPDVRGQAVTKAYAVLRKAGLEISIRESFSYTRHLHPDGIPVLLESPPNQYGMFARTLSSSLPTVVSLEPKPGSSDARGSTVVLAVSGRLILKTGQLRCDSPPDRAADLTGKTLSEALRYQDHCLGLRIEEIPPLNDGDGARLFDNYVVSQQTPAPGGPFPPVSASNPPGYTTLTVVVRRSS